MLRNTSACFALSVLAACGGGGGGGSNAEDIDTRADVTFASQTNQVPTGAGNVTSTSSFATAQNQMTFLPVGESFEGTITVFKSEKFARDSFSFTQNTAYVPTVANATILFRSNTQVVLTVNGVSRTLTDTGNPNFFEFTDGNAFLIILAGNDHSLALYYVDSNFDTNAEFEDFLPGGSASGNGGAFFQSDFVLGFPTDPTELAALANTVVDYTGSAIIGKSLPNVVGIDDAVGPAEFSVDFGTNLVTGQFDLTNSQASQSNLGGADGSLLLILEDGQVTPTGISGFVDVPEAELGDLSNTPNGWEAVRLDVEGVFYGPNAQELSGSLTGANAVVDVGNGEELVAPSDAIAGSFLTSQ